MIKSLKKTIGREKTTDKARAQRLLDVELASIASKEYNPNNLKLRDAPSNLDQYASPLQSNAMPRIP